MGMSCYYSVLRKQSEGKSGEPRTTEGHPNMRRAVGVAKVLLWVCAGLMAVLVILSWAAPGLRDESSFLLLGGTAVVPDGLFGVPAWARAAR